MGITIEQLNRLRGITSSGANSLAKSSQAKENVLMSGSADDLAKNSNVSPIKVQSVPCKTYFDEKGHFAYIDAETHEPVHFNTETGNNYTKEDIYNLSFNYAKQYAMDVPEYITANE